MQPNFFKIFAKNFIFFILFAFSTAIFAENANNSPVGYWETISDRTHQPSGIMQVTEKEGVLSGKIIKIYEQGGNKPTDLCVKCPGEFHNKLIEGLTVMWGLHETGDNRWGGGKIMDPKIGKIYSCMIRMYGDGKFLEVRGYIGISLLGRTQTWVRVHKKK